MEGKMYINRLVIENYRNHNKTDIRLFEGVNVIVGPNNSGKSNLLKTITFLTQSSRMNRDVHDFNKNYLIDNMELLKEKSPVIEIKYYVEHTLSVSNPGSAISKMQKITIYNAEGNLTEDEDEMKLYGAFILRFRLDPRIELEYLEKVNGSIIDNIDQLLNVISYFINHYDWVFYNIDGVNEIKKSVIEKLFTINNVDANRDINNITNNTKKFVKDSINLREVDTLQAKNDVTSLIKDRFVSVTDSINEQIERDQDEIGITNGKNKFISSFLFDSDFSDFFHYELINAAKGYNLPLFNNGLGYNNLIYIRNMINQSQREDYNILLIEEPEAHLHPNMQYKLLKYIYSLCSVEIEDKLFTNQIFITTHSPNITASAKLEDVIILDYSEYSESGSIINVSQLSNNYNLDYLKTMLSIDLLEDETQEEYEKFLKCFDEVLIKGKLHLQKFLDVTRSDILFASKVILVEGISEKLMFNKMVECSGYKKNLIDEYVSVVELGGINFQYFLPLFVNQNRKVLCITDVDYSRDLYSVDEEKYSELRAQIINNVKTREYSKLDMLKVVTQKNGGSTFESELFIDNYTNVSLLKEIFKLVAPDSLHELIDLGLNKDLWWEKIDDVHPKTRNVIKAFLEKYELSKDSSEKLLFTDIFYYYAKKMKGSLALDMINLNDVDFETPEYIKEGLRWLFS